MNGKIAVRFKSFKTTRYAYQKLKYCKICGRYTVLDGDTCPGCRRRKILIPADKHFDIIVRRRFQIDILILLILFFTGIVLAGNLHELYIMSFAGVLSIIVFLLLYKFFKGSEKAVLMQHFFSNNHLSIFDGLKRDAVAAGKKMEAGEFKEAYEDLREVGVLIRNDSVKLSKLVCLSRFIMRKDAELELETLVLSEYNYLFIDYLNEVVKLNRKLVKRSVIDYVIANEDMILQTKNGMEVLGNVAGAAIRTRQNVLIYKDFIMRYLKAMKEDRLVRLYRLLKEGHADELDGLYQAVAGMVNKYLTAYDTTSNL